MKCLEYCVKPIQSINLWGISLKIPWLGFTHIGHEGLISEYFTLILSWLFIRAESFKEFRILKDKIHVKVFLQSFERELFVT